MARIRTIKPEFFTDEKVGSVSPLHRLFFIGLWTLADRDGKLVYKAKELKIRLLPWDFNADVNELVNGLCDAGLIVKYSDSESSDQFLYIPGFTMHQVLNNKESFSKLPDPPVHVKDACSTRSKEGRKERKKRASVDASLGEDLPTEPGLSSIPNIRVLTDEMVATFQELKKSKYDFQPKDGVNLQHLIERAKPSHQEIMSRWKRGLELWDKWPGCSTISELCSRWNHLVMAHSVNSVKMLQPVAENNV